MRAVFYPSVAGFQVGDDPLATALGVFARAALWIPESPFEVFQGDRGVLMETGEAWLTVLGDE